MKNILSWEKLKKQVELRRLDGSRIVFTNGCFDIIHAGHVRYLQKAKNAGDILIVALNSDSSVRKIKGKRRPIVPQKERAEVVASLKSVDYVTLFTEKTPIRLIEYIRPDILVKGADWPEDQIIGRDSVLSWGGKVVLIPIVNDASTTKIIEKILLVYNEHPS
jgi:D-beta-D-heptose 7-phosphate kinase/D-beta-D-heptose 1-phosphate adenosyltransferase